MKTSLFSICLCAFWLFSSALAEDKPTSEPVQAATEHHYGSVEERRIMESIQAGGAPFARERDDIENRKKELKRLESEVDKKIEQLNQLRVRIEQMLAQKSAEEQKRIGELAKMYDKMSPEKAATVIGGLDQQLAIAILAQMKTKSAAKILNTMERDKASKLTTAFSTLETP